MLVLNRNEVFNNLESLNRRTIIDTDSFVAVSYAHDGDEFKEKVVAFVSCLREKHGYNAIMDEYVKQKETVIDFNDVSAR